MEQEETSGRRAERSGVERPMPPPSSSMRGGLNVCSENTLSLTSVNTVARIMRGGCPKARTQSSPLKAMLKPG